MKNEFGHDTSRWKMEDAGMHFAEGMYMDQSMGDFEGTTEVFTRAYLTGYLDSAQLTWMHRNGRPAYRKPFRILAWMRRRLELPFHSRIVKNNQLITVYRLTDVDREILEAAFHYLRRGDVAEKIRYENRDPRNDEDGMG